jgi:hypothetical protein
MMIVVAHLKLSGFFRLVTGWALACAHSPLIPRGFRRDDWRVFGFPGQ